MKVNMQQIETGVANYLDNELLTQWEKTAWQKVVVGIGVSLGIKRYSALAATYLQNPMFKEVGVVDDNGDVDIDLLREVVKENIDNEGFKIDNIPIIGTLMIKKSDVDSLYDYITAPRK